MFRIEQLQLTGRRTYSRKYQSRWRKKKEEGNEKDVSRSSKLSTPENTRHTVEDYYELA